MKKSLLLILFLALVGAYFMLPESKEPSGEGLSNHSVESEGWQKRHEPDITAESSKLPRDTPPSSEENDPSKLSEIPSDEPASDQQVSDQQVYSQARTTLLARRVGSYWVTQEDLLVDPAMLTPGVGNREARLAEISRVQYWPSGIVPYEIEKGPNRKTIRAAMRELEDQSPVQFVKRTDEQDYVVFAEPSDGEDICLSYLGKKGGLQLIVLHPSCSKGQILHELLHTLGFVHEHSREDRDEFIEIHWENIEAHRKNQFQKLPAHLSIPVDLPFDFDSILMYSRLAFTLNGERTITRRDETDLKTNRRGLSDLDIERVNILYSR